MGKPYPLAFRKRVVAAVESGDLSCNQAAKQFGIGISTAIGWVNRLRKTGSLAPGQMGGHKPKAISGDTVSGSCSEPRMATSPCGACR
jgi:transposase